MTKRTQIRLAAPIKRAAITRFHTIVYTLKHEEPGRVFEACRPSVPLGSALSAAAEVTRRVRRWRRGDMRLRRSAAALLEAEKNFHRIRGHGAMPKRLTALDKNSNAETSRAGQRERK